MKGCAKEYRPETEVAKVRDKNVEFEGQDANEHDLKLDTKESDRGTESANECDKNVEDEQLDVNKYRGNRVGGRAGGREGVRAEHGVQVEREDT